MSLDNYIVCEQVLNENVLVNKFGFLTKLRAQENHCLPICQTIIFHTNALENILFYISMFTF